MCFKKFNSGVNKSIFPELGLSFFDKRFIFFDTPRIYGKMTGLSGGLKKQRGLFHKRPPYRFSIGIILKAKRLFRLSVCKDAAFIFIMQIKKHILQHIFN